MKVIDLPAQSLALDSRREESAKDLGGVAGGKCGQSLEIMPSRCGTRSGAYRKLSGATACGAVMLAGCVLPVLAFLSAASLARAQATPSFVAANAYNAQPGTVPVQVATGIFNQAGSLLDFAVLEQVPDTGSYQVEIFHGKPDGTFCTGCGTSDLISMGPGVIGKAIAVGQFASTGYCDRHDRRNRLSRKRRLGKL